jgi:hypothetical protein
MWIQYMITITEGERNKYYSKISTFEVAKSWYKIFSIKLATRKLSIYIIIFRTTTTI